MRSFRIRTRAVLASVPGALLFGLVPAAAAQQLFPVVGVPIAYEVSLPVGWDSDNSDPELLLVHDGDVVIMVGATDLMAEEAEDDGGPMSDAELKERRRFTQMVIQDDSLLMSMVSEGFLGASQLEDEGRVQEIRTLGGQRSAYVRGRYREDGEPGWLQLHITMRDGIVYMLAFTTRGDDPGAHADLLDRVHASFVLAK